MSFIQFPALSRWRVLKSDVFKIIAKQTDYVSLSATHFHCTLLIMIDQWNSDNFHKNISVHLNINKIGSCLKKYYPDSWFLL